MALRKYKPTSPGRRFMTVSTFEEITKTEPEKSLLRAAEEIRRRNSYGRITRRHRAESPQAPLPRHRLKADEGRRACQGGRDRARPEPVGAHRACSTMRTAPRPYLAPARLRVGAVVESGPDADIRPGGALPLANIPTGTVVHNVELKPGRGGQMARSAGSGIQLVAKDGQPRCPASPLG